MQGKKKGWRTDASGTPERPESGYEVPRIAVNTEDLAVEKDNAVSVELIATQQKQVWRTRLGRSGGVRL